MPPPNVTSALDRPIVVYDIDATSGVTRYPALKVIEADGKERQLNEQEKIFQVTGRFLSPTQADIAYFEFVLMVPCQIAKMHPICFTLAFILMGCDPGPVIHCPSSRSADSPSGLCLISYSASEGSLNLCNGIMTIKGWLNGFGCIASVPHIV